MNFSEGVDGEVLTPYLDALIQKLLTLLQVRGWISHTFERHTSVKGGQEADCICPLHALPLMPHPVQHGRKLVQEGALTALASVADSSQVRDVTWQAEATW